MNLLSDRNVNYLNVHLSCWKMLWSTHLLRHLLNRPNIELIPLKQADMHLRRKRIFELKNWYSSILIPELVNDSFNYNCFYFNFHIYLKNGFFFVGVMTLRSLYMWYIPFCFFLESIPYVIKRVILI